MARLRVAREPTLRAIIDAPRVWFRVQVGTAPADGLAWTCAGLRVALPPPAPNPPMSPLPDGLRPMLAVTTTAVPADAAGWAAEVKWDGYRALCRRDDERMRLHRRRGTDMAPWFPELGGLHHALGPHEVVLDGEVVALGTDGRPAFELLQQRMRRRPTPLGRRPPDTAPVVYLVFDVLWLDGRLVTGLPFTQRRGLLEGLGLAGSSWQTTTLFPGQAAELAEASRQQGLEGVVVKRLQAHTGRDAARPTGGSSSTTTTTCSWSAGMCPAPTAWPRCWSVTQTPKPGGCGSSAAWSMGCWPRPAGGWPSYSPAPAPRPARSSVRSPPVAVGDRRRRRSRRRCSSTRSWRCGSATWGGKRAGFRHAAYRGVA